MMNALRFIQILESYGADSARWPAHERQAATDFAVRHPTGQALMSEAQVLDAALASVTAPAPSELLRARILKTASPQSVTPTTAPVAANDRLPYRALAATLLVSACVGFLSRGLAIPSSTATSEIEIATNSLEDDTDYAWMDLAITESFNE